MSHIDEEVRRGLERRAEALPMFHDCDLRKPELCFGTNAGLVFIAYGGVWGSSTFRRINSPIFRNVTECMLWLTEQERAVQSELSR